MYIIPLIKRIWRWLTKSSVSKPLPPIEPQETIRLVFESKQLLEQFVLKQSTMDKVIQDARLAGQVALVEQLGIERLRRIAENALVVHGHSRYISEESLVEIAQKSSRGFCLDWIKNFVRPLPPDVLAKKVRLDKALIFDNYLVLHYDPLNKSNKKTQTEIRQLLDPILFGVIKGSRKLYFVADWIDEYCDLTFEQLIKIADELHVSSAKHTTL